MTVSIKACFNRLNPTEGVYRVDLDIVDVVNIDFDVLVFDTKTDEFSRVASVFDMESVPVEKDPGCGFFRGRGAKVPFNNIRDATGFEIVNRNRLKILAVAWNTIVESFSGKTVFIVDSNVEE